MRYQVRAADAGNRLTTVVLDAADAADARRQALRLQLLPVSVTAQRQGGLRRAGGGFQLGLFAQELQMLLEAGLPLAEAIEGLAERQTAGQGQAVCAALAVALRNGDRLSAAMARQGELFPPLFVGIVRAAERTSSLAPALARYGAYDAHLRLLRERLASAAIYPAILLLAGGAVTLFLLTYVVPRFADVYAAGDRPLPAVSQALMTLGTALSGRGHWVLLAVGLALALIVAAAARRRREGAALALAWLRSLAWLPGVAPRLATLERARLYRTLGLLLEGGLTVRDALGLAEGVLGPGRAAALAAVQRQVLGGQPLSAGLQQAGLSTPLAQRLLQVGERSGRLGAMLERAAQFHEHETALWVDRFSKVFGPLLMVLISLVVGGVVVALYIPIFDLVGSLR